MALQSKKLSKNLTASFVKVLLKLILTQNSTTSITLSFLVFNLFKKREGIRDMLKVSKQYDPKQDPFLLTADIFGNKIIESCFWEAKVLERHFLGEVRFVF